jgi:CubicO group peptidase (beta-lactamase class C family)
MKKLCLFALFVFAFINNNAQNYYFPPTVGTQWDTVSPASLNWCTNKLDTLYTLLETKNSKAFIILKGGKIALEKYFGGFTKDSLWYWASAGKTLAGFLTGIAQQEGKLKITDTVSKYLGKGWTQCTPQQEEKITIWNQLTMTNGLDDNLPPTTQIPDPDNCLEPECLQYKADAGTRWAYHNAPYHLLHDVIDSATGYTMNQYTTQKIRTVTGMQGLWYDYIFYSRPRDMARFGSLIINKGKWSNTTILKDTAYLNAATNTSQNLNLAYGYLWWLNGKSSYKAPGLQLTLNGYLVPNAPADMYAALGKNDQKLYIIPSMDMVIVRMGNASGQVVASVSSFDNELWGVLKDVFCPSGPNTAVKTFSVPQLTLYPNPVTDILYCNVEAATPYIIADVCGRTVQQNFILPNQPINVSTLAKGMYIFKVLQNNGVQTLRFIKE